MAQKTSLLVSAEESRARKIITNSEVDDIRLLHCETAQMLRDGDLPDSLDNSIESEGTFVKRHNAIVMLHRLRVIGKYKSKSTSDEPPLLIEAVYRAQYQLTGKHEVSQRDLAAFAQTISLLHVWPYWRELVQSMTTRMGLPPLTIPLFKIPGWGTKKKTARTRSAPRKKKSS
jgi:preprotein translocase subunit SecB